MIYGNNMEDYNKINKVLSISTKRQNVFPNLGHSGIR